jgi:LL-diaminopimelate aminotransferase
MEQRSRSISSLEITLSKRLSLLPPYLFLEIDRKKREALARGVDLINLGIGDPDIPTPQVIIDALKVAAEKPANHRYPETEGLPAFRQACSDWYRQRFGVELDSDKEVLTLIGAKEGIGHLPLALLEPGDVVLMPDPAYPVYYSGTIFAGGQPHFMPLQRENGFLPDLAAIPPDVANRAKLMFINYPNNPTGAVAPLDFYREVVDFAARYGIVVCADNTYSEIRFDGYKPASMLEAPGGKEVGIEIHSLSKTFSMTGWRIGCAVGHPTVVQGLCAIKSNLDSGAFQAVQEAGIAAFEHADEIAETHSAVYQERRDVLVAALQNIGITVEPPKASFYVWAPVPAGHTSASFVDLLLDRAGIVCTPGRGFGVYGEGYIRIALTADVSRLREAGERIAKLDL